MKDFFKKNPQLLYTLIAVIVIDSAIIWFSMADNAATAKKLEQLNGLKTKAGAISNSTFKTNMANAKKAKENAEKIILAFNEKFDKKLEQYRYKKTPEETYGSKPRALTNFRDLLEKLTTDLKDINKTTDGLSFTGYQSQILEMSDEEIEKIFEIMNGFNKIAQHFVESEISSVDSVERPLELSFIEDKDLKTKTYSYKINLAGDGGSVKRLINLISGDEEYFFEISSISLLADKQIETEASKVAPLVGREAKKRADTGNPGATLDDLAADLNGVPDPDDGGPQIAKESIAPFSSAVNRVELIIDWIQFTKDTK